MARIYVYCPDLNVPIGGAKMLYRHVDILRELGHEAYALHRSPGFRFTWFGNTTPVQHDAEIKLEAEDFLLVPEIISIRVLRQYPRAKKIVFNQNAYNTFLSFALNEAEDFCPYKKATGFLASLVVSEDNRAYLSHAFPDHKIHRLHYSVDAKLFHPREKKKPQIAFMPRKNFGDAMQVFGILKARKALEGFTIKPIDGKSEEDVAALLRESAYFFSFGYPEGCPIPPLEAMFSGALVVGYHGRGGREYFLPEFSYPAEVNDIIGFASQAEAALSLWKREPGVWAEKTAAALAYVSDTFNLAREKADIESAWRSLTAKS